MALTYGQAEFALAFANNIAPDGIKQFRARIKQWQKMGFPEGVNVGKGAKAQYGATQIYQLGIMLKLLHIGLTPERAQMVVRLGWPIFRDTIVHATKALASDSGELHYCFVQLDALSDLKEEPADHMHIFVQPITGSQLYWALVDSEDDWPENEKYAHLMHTMVVKNKLAISISIEIDSMLTLLWAAIEASDASITELSEEVSKWAADLEELDQHPPEQSPHFDDTQNYANQSIVDRVRDLDVADTARQILRGKIDGEN